MMEYKLILSQNICLPHEGRQEWMTLPKSPPPSPHKNIMNIEMQQLLEEAMEKERSVIFKLVS